ncbi:MAG: hypothetical protein V7731_08275 [Amphritea sp.]
MPLGMTQSISRLASTIARLCGVMVLLLIAPLIGAYLVSSSLDTYLNTYLVFPPTTIYMPQPGFYWPVFVVLLLIIIATLTPFLVRIIRVKAVASGKLPCGKPFPWWGWLGCALIGIGWVVAWARYPALEAWQRYDFFALWAGFILLMNSLSYKRTGDCLLLSHPGRFLMLFPLSALFWWFFEYLNLFANNWYYLGYKQTTALEYALSATLSFSTVLPAVICCSHWLASFQRLDQAFTHCWPVRPPYPRILALIAVVATLASLVGLGGWPRFFFPLTWVSPLVILISIQVLSGQETIFTPLMRGDWRPVCLPALAGLLCGFCWELWNFGSIDHWEYSIPYVSRFYLFEMPILGYSGYLPFGIQCMLAASLLSATPVSKIEGLLSKGQGN